MNCIIFTHKMDKNWDVTINKKEQNYIPENVTFMSNKNTTDLLYKKAIFCKISNKQYFTIITL